ncbi:hypothetical protein [Aeoliella mucimassa]|uniref:hypothetical protein n=1 Tax=Aeoliella mucimassa TaxID=2527972 RepID=UPI00119E6821|nr:hypothetical protein [Aeoliella mucimassa]
MRSRLPLLLLLLRRELLFAKGFSPLAGEFREFGVGGLSQQAMLAVGEYAAEVCLEPQTGPLGLFLGLLGWFGGYRTAAEYQFVGKWHGEFLV